MEQFSHDLSLALEETSRITGARRNIARRRTRSTGNLPCAPQPTEDSSSSPEDLPNHYHNSAIRGLVEGVGGGGGGASNVLSDSDTGVATGVTGGVSSNARSSSSRFPSTNVRPDVSQGNFESDSLNETFSPARPSCARRKRKFKRMAVEYDIPNNTNTTTTTTTPTNILSASASGTHATGLGRLALYTGGNPSSSLCNSVVQQGGGGSYGGMGHHLINSHKSMMPKYGGSCQENFRANLFFCGKRKRSHRDRYDYDNHHHQHRGGHPHHHHHSSSVPRGGGQRGDLFSTSGTTNGIIPGTTSGATGGAPTNTRASYLEHIHRNNNNNSCNNSQQRMNKIQPLNKSIISKIERISLDQATAAGLPRPTECEFKPIDNPRTMLGEKFRKGDGGDDEEDVEGTVELDEDDTMGDATTTLISIPGAVAVADKCVKTGSLESNFSFQEYGSCSGNSGLGTTTNNLIPNNFTQTMTTGVAGEKPKKRSHARRHQERQKRSAMQIQFWDPSFPDCPMAGDSASSSLSSSDSETDKTCDSDREGDDELTDWPGNEGTMTVLGVGGGGGSGSGSGGGDFKRTKSQKAGAMKGGVLLAKSDDTQDEDTRMSAEELGVLQGRESMRMLPIVLPLKPGFVPVQAAASVGLQPVVSSSSVATGFLSRVPSASMPIDMPTTMHVGACGGAGGFVFGPGGSGSFIAAGVVGPQIESEMSGETSNHFLSSPNGLNEVREFRAGCRRVREERPSFSVITSVNEELSKFLQDGKQTQLHLADTDAMEHEKLSDLAKLYSLHMRVDRGIAVLTKTSNTTQPVRVDRSNMSKRYLSDFKRRCYEEAAAAEGRGVGGGGECPTMAMTEEQEMNDIQS